MWGLLVFFSLAAGYLTFICAVSLRFGITHAHQPGWWMPVFFAFSCLLAAFWPFFRLLRYVLRRLQETEGRID
jgi:ABC-type transport system involved in multi-copper enzyme maturation permease subunit